MHTCDQMLWPAAAQATMAQRARSPVLRHQPHGDIIAARDRDYRMACGHPGLMLPSEREGTQKVSDWKASQGSLVSGLWM